jgi:hypothetical protein
VIIINIAGFMDFAHRPVFGTGHNVSEIISVSFLMWRGGRYSPLFHPDNGQSPDMP